MICAVDDRRAQLLINRWAYHHKKPAVYIGIFAGAKSGEVCWVDPPLPCYQCATKFREVLAPDAIGATDYGTGQLVAEVALGIDIQAVTTIGIRLALSALVRDQESSLASYVNNLGLKQYIVLAVDPNDQHISPYFDPDMPGQYGHKSLWMQPSKADACNVCGENPDPPQATVSLSHDAIKDAIAQQQAAAADTEGSSAHETGASAQETGSPEPMTTPASEITQTSPSSDESTATVEPERDIWQPPTIDN